MNLTQKCDADRNISLGKPLDSRADANNGILIMQMKTLLTSGVALSAFLAFAPAAYAQADNPSDTRYCQPGMTAMPDGSPCPPMSEGQANGGTTGTGSTGSPDNSSNAGNNSSAGGNNSGGNNSGGNNSGGNN